MNYAVSLTSFLNRCLRNTVARNARFMVRSTSPSFNPSFNPGKSLGVTLPELLVSLSVAAVLISVSVPSMKSLIINNRIDNVADEVWGSLMLARSEAVKRQRTVSLCSSIDEASCDEDNAGWHHGWLVFTDANADGLLNEGDQLLRRVAGQWELIAITWNRGFSLRFNSRGQSSQSGTFRVCDPSDSDLDSKALVISLSGRIRTEEQGACS